MHSGVRALIDARDYEKGSVMQYVRSLQTALPKVHFHQRKSVDILFTDEVGPI